MRPDTLRRPRPAPAPAGGGSRHPQARAIAGALAVVAFALSWFRHDSFRSLTLDLAVFDQAIWKLAHFTAPEVTTIGWNAFADHISPVLLLFVPFYWLAATPAWLFAAQALALGAGYLALDPLFDTVGLAGRWRWLLRIAYITSPLLWNGVLYDFHPTTLAVPFLLVGLRAALTSDRRGLLLCSAALLFLRDDLGLMVTVLALWGALSPAARPHRRFRFGLAGAGLAWTVMGGQIGGLLGSDRHWDFHYGYLGGVPEAAATHPLRTIVRLAEAVLQGDNTILLLGLLLPLAFLPLGSPRRAALLLVPLLPMLASAGPQFHSPQWHYGAPLFPFLLAASAVALTRLRPSADAGRVTLVTVAAILVGAFAFGPPSTGALTKPAIPKDDAQQALALIRPDDAVAADDRFGPHLSERDLLLIHPYPFFDPKPDLPLSEKAREVSQAKAARIDAVVTVLSERSAKLDYQQAFLASPWLEEFHVAGRFGNVVVYRRN